MKIFVSNQQKRYKINRQEIEIMAKALSEALFHDFRNNKIKKNWTKYLDQIESSAFISLFFVSPRIIKKLNKEWLEKDKETDVLSFPMLDFSLAELKSLFSLKRGRPQTNQSADQDELELGEIFICYEQAIKQAKEYNHSLEREIAFLIVHGLLHIFGFDHQNKADEKEMFGRQRKILIGAGYSR